MNIFNYDIMKNRESNYYQKACLISEKTSNR